MFVCVIKDLAYGLLNAICFYFTVKLPICPVMVRTFTRSCRTSENTSIPKDLLYSVYTNNKINSGKNHETYT